jgi:tetratricopeptide (TPR) repeat protein
MGRSVPGQPKVKADRFRAARPLLAFAPLALLALIEALLRACGYGYPAGYFRPAPEGRPAVMGNPDFLRLFFPPRLEPYPEPFLLPVPKPADVCRIFVLGESAALGIPDPAFGLPRVLERMLAARHPGTRFEVTGLAVTAIDSHVLLPMARAAARTRPDLFVLYMGNNEFIGPYGPGTVFAPFAEHPGLVRASLALKSLRLGQWLDARLHPPAPPAAGRPEKWAGMEMFLEHAVARGDARIEATYRNFRSNVDGILDAARGAGARVVVASMAVNRRSNAPFASRHRAGLPAADSLAWAARADSAAAYEAAGRADAALAAWRAAIAIDPAMAEAHWRAARLLGAAGRAAAADSEFQRAVDEDALRFRADSRINGILRAAAEARRGGGAWFCDADGLLRSAEADSAAPPLFYEHVHLRFEGTYRLAAGLLPSVEAALADAGFAREPAQPVPDREAVRAALALTPWNEWGMAKKIAAMAARPPFTARSDAAALQASLRREVDSLAGFTSNEAMQGALEAYQAALAARPGDPVLSRDLGELFYATDYLTEAAERFRAVLAILPQDTRARQMLAKSLAEQGNAPGAAREYAAALEYEPGSVELRNGLGMALASQGEQEKAIAAYREALAANPAWPEVHFNLARSYAALDRPRDAVAELETALRLDPGFAPAERELERLRDAYGGGGR